MARHRQQLGEARVEDRFSGGLRVLAVAAGPVTEGPIEPRSTVPLLAPGHEGVRARLLERTGASDAPPAPGSGAGLVPATGTTGRTDTRRGEQPMQDSRESRLTVIEERARRARRRLVLTLVLLVATVAGWVAVATAQVVWWAALVPTALLAVVLVLGRLAAMSARKADQRRAAERRAAERKALQARSLAAGGPRAPRNRARVTGVAVRGSGTSTQMIPRVVQEAKGADGERGGERPEPARADATAAAERATTATVAGEADADDKPVIEVAAAEPAAGDASGAVVEASKPRAPEAGSSWDPRPMPLPTYVTKPAAPRREPWPLTDTAVVASTGWTTRPWQRAEAMGGLRALEVAPEVAPAPVGAVAVIEAVDVVEVVEVVEVADEAPTADDAQPSTETLGLPLEQILARRRAAG